MNNLLKEIEDVLQKHFKELINFKLEDYYLPSPLHLVFRDQLQEEFTNLDLKKYNFSPNNHELDELAVIAHLVCEYFRNESSVKLDDRFLKENYFTYELEEPESKEPEDEYLTEEEYQARLKKAVKEEDKNYGISRTRDKKKYKEDIDRLIEYDKYLRELDVKYLDQMFHGPVAKAESHLITMVTVTTNLKSFKIPPFLVDKFIDFMKFHFRRVASMKDGIDPKVFSKQPIANILANEVCFLMIPYLEERFALKSPSKGLSNVQTGIIGSILTFVGLVDTFDNYKLNKYNEDGKKVEYLKYMGIVVRNYLRR